MNEHILAIDCGTSSGAYCFGCNNIELTVKITGESPRNLLEFLQKHSIGVIIVIERPPKSMGFNTGNASVKLWGQYQRICGWLEGMGRKWVDVTPQKWQKMCNLPKGLKGDVRKDVLWEVAKEKHPDYKIYKYVADSVLLWDWYKMESMVDRIKEEEEWLG